ncbi:hypothetical protein EBZ80_08650 [bacterium]|jgi:hypothetical protein|nr:hypothetical protein [bacterium]
MTLRPARGARNRKIASSAAVPPMPPEQKVALGSEFDFHARSARRMEEVWIHGKQQIDIIGIRLVREEV